MRQMSTSTVCFLKAALGWAGSSPHGLKIFFHIFLRANGGLSFLSEHVFWTLPVLLFSPQSPRHATCTTPNSNLTPDKSSLSTSNSKTCIPGVLPQAPWWLKRNHWKSAARRSTIPLRIVEEAPTPTPMAQHSQVRRNIPGRRIIQDPPQKKTSPPAEI